MAERDQARPDRDSTRRPSRTLGRAIGWVSSCSPSATGTPRPTAIFATSDTIAIGLMQAAYQARVVVPEQLSIVGFDNIDIAAFTIPPLTTVSQAGVEMGRTAATILLDMIEHDRPADEIDDVVMLPTLVVREVIGGALRWSRLAMDPATGREFTTVFGRGLVGELRSSSRGQNLVVTMDDLWPKFALELDDGPAASISSESSTRELRRGAAPRPAGASSAWWRRRRSTSPSPSPGHGLPIFQVPTAMTVNSPFGHRAGIRDRRRRALHGSGRARGGLRRLRRDRLRAAPPEPKRGRGRPVLPHRLLRLATGPRPRARGAAVAVSTSRSSPRRAFGSTAFSTTSTTSGRSTRSGSGPSRRPTAGVARRSTTRAGTRATSRVSTISSSTTSSA